MKLGVLFSGGKDSCLALHKAIGEGHEIVCLLSMVPETKDSFMFHTPELGLLKKQAEELGIKLIIQKTKGEKEAELADLEKLISKAKQVDGICVGGIASEYQGSRVKSICKKFGLEFYAPILGYGSENLWKELIDSKFEVILTKISCEGLGKEWIGKVIDYNMYEKLKKLSTKYKFRPDFEGGEAESAVLYMPEFKKKIEIDFSVESEGSYRHFIKILNIK